MGLFDFTDGFLYDFFNQFFAKPIAVLNPVFVIPFQNIFFEPVEIKVVLLAKWLRSAANRLCECHNARK